MSEHSLRVVRPAAAASCLALVSTLAVVHAAQPQFFELVGAADFLAGELDGLSVDSDGHLSLAPETRELFDTATPAVWALAADGKDTLYAGTGNEGQVFRIRDGQGALFFKADELEVHALALGPDGRLYAGTSPDGKVYAVDRDGTGSVFFDPAEKYIWALAFDGAGRLLVATGSEARLYRVDKQGQAELLLKSAETHLTALAVGAGGRVYAGSAPGGVVYRVDQPGRAFVLVDSAHREVKALDVAPDGAVYAALFEGAGTDASATPAPAPVTTAIAGGEPTVAVTETFAITVAALTSGAGAVPGASRGAVVRLHDGDIETLWFSHEDAPHALAWTPGGVLVGTGDKGKLFRLRDDQSWSMLATFAAQQATALARAADGAVVLATSNGGKVHLVAPRARARGAFTSAVKDTGTVSSFGRVRLEARPAPGTRVTLETRSGNTATADDTWSEWSSLREEGDGAAVASPRARFVQVRATLHGKDGRTPVVDAVRLAFQQRNLRPAVTSITVHPPGAVFQKPITVTGELEVLGLDRGEQEEEDPAQTAARNAALAANPYSRKIVRPGIQTLSWAAQDPNQDRLTFDLHYRGVSESRFRLLRADLQEPVYAWDTTALPDGRYVVKVTARDTPGNPPALALAGDKESAPFDVDNTPPGIVAALVGRSPARVRVTARDAGGLIRRAEYALGGGRWVEVHPLDGINDSSEELYEIAPETGASPGPHVVVVRVTDSLGNLSTAQVELP